MTLLFGIIGDPIAQVRSPEVFNARFGERGIDAVMVPMRVAADDFEAVVTGLRAIENLAGLVVTVPHKPAAARVATSRSDRVRIAGAANALRPCPTGWDGDLFDGEGFAIGLAAHGHSVEGMNCSIVGAGGAGAAIALALIERRAASVTLWDIDGRKASRLAERLAAETRTSVTVDRPGPRSDLAVNATPLGMNPDDCLPFSVEVLRPDSIVAEAVMKPPVTRLLDEAKRHGCRIQEGRHMLDRQVNAIWRFFDLA